MSTLFALSVLVSSITTTEPNLQELAKAEIEKDLAALTVEVDKIDFSKDIPSTGIDFYLGKFRAAHKKQTLAYDEDIDLNRNQSAN